MSGAPTRRAALAAIAALATTACTTSRSPDDVGGVPDRASSSPPATTPEPTASRPSPAVTAPAVPAVVPYALLPGEVEPACKQAALDAATAVLAVDASAPDPAAAAAGRLAGLAQDAAPLDPLRSLVPAGASAALQVVYPQYGGLDAARRSASVMLVADLLVAGPPQGSVPSSAAGTDPGPGPERRSTTVDLRLSSSGGRWTVTEVLVPQLPPPLPGEQLSAATRELLATDRVVLPGAARADLLAGGVHETVVTTLLALSQTWRLHVQVLTSGHPVNVFATDRVSNHTRGRAVDLWALDGVPVVEQDRSPWRDVVEAATALGASEVGGPLDLGGDGQFTDQVHQDHLHLGFGRA